MKLFFNFFLGVLFWGTYFLPIHSFEKAFRILSLEAKNLSGIYSSTVSVFSVLAIVITFLLLWLSPKFFHKLSYRIGILIFYLGFYCFACLSIAWDYSIVLGNTWQWSEIFLELVKPKWYFYAFGTLGIIFNYQFLRLTQRRTIKKLVATRCISNSGVSDKTKV